MDFWNFQMILLTIILCSVFYGIVAATTQDISFVLLIAAIIVAVITVWWFGMGTYIRWFSPC